MISEIIRFIARKLEAPPLPPDDDIERLSRRLESAGQITSTTPRRPVIDNRLAELSFARKFSVPICLAQKSSNSVGTNNLQSVSLQLVDESARAQPERITDQSDLRIPLAQVLGDAYLEAGHGSAVFRHSQDMTVVLSIVLLIDDSQWDPQSQYLRVELKDVVDKHTSVLVFGERETILARVAAAAAVGGGNRPKVTQAACSFSRPGFAGWCMHCASRPQAFTLFHSPLAPDAIAQYATELLGISGTHDQVKDARAQQSQCDDRIEVRPESSLGQALCQRGLAMHQAASMSSDNTIFVAREEWLKELDSACRRVLFTLPVSHINTASITIAARSDQEFAGKQLSVKLIVQCIGPSLDTSLT